MDHSGAMFSQPWSSGGEGADAPRDFMPSEHTSSSLFVSGEAGFGRGWTSGQQMASHREKIGREDRGVHLAFERFCFSPCTAVETERPLEEGDHALDARPEVTEPPLDPTASGHLADLEAAFLLEAHVLDPHGLGILQAVFGGEPAVRGRLSGRAAVERLLPLKHGESQGGIGWGPPPR